MIDVVKQYCHKIQWHVPLLPGLYFFGKGKFVYVKKNKDEEREIYNTKTGKNIEGHLIQPFYSVDRTNHDPDKWNGPSHGGMHRLYTTPQDYNLSKSDVSSTTLGRDVYLSGSQHRYGPFKCCNREELHGLESIFESINRDEVNQ